MKKYVSQKVCLVAECGHVKNILMSFPLDTMSVPQDTMPSPQDTMLFPQDTTSFLGWKIVPSKIMSNYVHAAMEEGGLAPVKPRLTHHFVWNASQDHLFWWCYIYFVRFILDLTWSDYCSVIFLLPLFEILETIIHAKEFFHQNWSANVIHHYIQITITF